MGPTRSPAGTRSAEVDWLEARIEALEQAVDGLMELAIGEDPVGLIRLIEDRKALRCDNG
jgi:hypothetical protein